jgi:hypothetical protein
LPKKKKKNMGKNECRPRPSCSTEEAGLPKKNAKKKSQKKMNAALLLDGGEAVCLRRVWKGEKRGKKECTRTIL